MSTIVFIGVPYWLGRKDDYSGSVDIVRSSDVVAATGAEWIEIDPQFDAFDDPVNAVNSAVASAIERVLDDGKRPIVIADDCTVCLGNMKGLERFSPDVLWYDAHGDFNTPETTPSEFLGGMPLAAMVGLGNQHLLHGIGLDPVDDAKVYLTDGRDLDPGEAQLVADSQLTHWPTLDDERAYDWQNRSLYIHFDGDIIRLEDYPAVSYPAAAGPSAEECQASLRHALQSADVKGVHVTCWNAKRDGASQSQATMLGIIRTLAEELQG